MVPGNEDGLFRTGPCSVSRDMTQERVFFKLWYRKMEQSVGKHERTTHQIRIATIIRPAFCRRQSDLEGEAAIPDLFLEHREGHLPPVVNVGDAGHQQFETVRLSVRTLQV